MNSRWPDLQVQHLNSTDKRSLTRRARCQGIKRDGTPCRKLLHWLRVGEATPTGVYCASCAPRMRGSVMELIMQARKEIRRLQEASCK